MSCVTGGKFGGGWGDQRFVTKWSIRSVLVRRDGLSGIDSHFLIKNS